MKLAEMYMRQAELLKDRNKLIKDLEEIEEKIRVSEALPVDLFLAYEVASNTYRVSLDGIVWYSQHFSSEAAIANAGYKLVDGSFGRSYLNLKDVGVWKVKGTRRDLSVCPEVPNLWN